MVISLVGGSPWTLGAPGHCPPACYGPGWGGGGGEEQGSRYTDRAKEALPTARWGGNCDNERTDHTNHFLSLNMTTNHLNIVT